MVLIYFIAHMYVCTYAKYHDMTPSLTKATKYIYSKTIQFYKKHILPQRPDKMSNLPKPLMACAADNDKCAKHATQTAITIGGCFCRPQLVFLIP